MRDDRNKLDSLETALEAARFGWRSVLDYNCLLRLQIAQRNLEDWQGVRMHRLQRSASRTLTSVLLEQRSSLAAADRLVIIPLCLLALLDDAGNGASAVDHSTERADRSVRRQREDIFHVLRFLRRRNVGLLRPRSQG